MFNTSFLIHAIIVTNRIFRYYAFNVVENAKTANYIKQFNPFKELYGGQTVGRNSEPSLELMTTVPACWKGKKW